MFKSKPKELWTCAYCGQPIYSNQQSRVFSTKKAVLHFHYIPKQVDCYKEYEIDQTVVRGRE